MSRQPVTIRDADIDALGSLDLKLLYKEQTKYIYYSVGYRKVKVAEYNGGIGMFELQRTWDKEKDALRFICKKYKEYRLYGRWQP